MLNRFLPPGQQTQPPAQLQPPPLLQPTFPWSPPTFPPQQPRCPQHCGKGSAGTASPASGPVGSVAWEAPRIHPPNEANRTISPHLVSPPRDRPPPPVQFHMPRSTETYSPGRASLKSRPRLATAPGGHQQTTTACVSGARARQDGRGRPKGHSVEVPLTSLPRAPVSANFHCAETSEASNTSSGDAQSAHDGGSQNRTQSSPTSGSLSLKGSLSMPVLPASLKFGAARQRWLPSVATPGANGQVSRIRAGEGSSIGPSNTGSVAFGAVLSCCPGSITANRDESRCPSPKARGRESVHTSGTATPTGRTVESAELSEILHHHSSHEEQADALSTSRGSIPEGPVLCMLEQPGSGSAVGQTASSSLADGELRLAHLHLPLLPQVQISSVQAVSGPPSARLTMLSPKACMDCSQRGSSAPERRLASETHLAAPLRSALRRPQSGIRSPPHELHERPCSPPQMQRLQTMQEPQQQRLRSASEANKEPPWLQSYGQVLNATESGTISNTCTEVVEEPAISDLRASLNFARSMVEWKDFGALAEEIRHEFRAMQQGLQMLETMFADELRTCKEAIRCEASQREENCTQLERSFNEALEEESEKLQSVESQLDARVSSLHADISARLKDELSDTLDEIHTALTERSTTINDSKTAQRGPSMSSLEERPEQELLERLGEAVENEAAARRALEVRLQVQLDRFASEFRETLPHSNASSPDIAAGRAQWPRHSREERHDKHIGPYAASAKSTMGSNGTRGTGNTSGDELGSMLPVFLKDLMSWDRGAEEGKSRADCAPDPGSWQIPRPLQQAESPQTWPVPRTEKSAAQARSTESVRCQDQKSKPGGPGDNWEVKAIHEAVSELHGALRDGLRREAEARAEALAGLQAPELGTIVSEQDMLFKAVANLDSKIGVIQRDLDLSVQQMSQQSAEIITVLRGQEAFQAASKVLSMSGLPASGGEKPLQS